MSSKPSKRQPRPIFGKAFWQELAVYASLILLYIALVLKTLSAPLFELEKSEPGAYAVAAVLLILIQGIVLEMVTGVLLRFFRRRA